MGILGASLEDKHNVESTSSSGLLESEASEVPVPENQETKSSLAILPALPPWTTDDADAVTGKDDNIPNDDAGDMPASKEEPTETGTDGIVIASPKTNLTIPSTSAPSHGKKKSKQSKQKKLSSSNKSKNSTSRDRGSIV